MNTLWLWIVLVSSAIAAPVATTSVSCLLPPEPHISYIPPSATPEALVHRVFNISSFGFENLAVRANGHILATAAFGPFAGLWQIDPLSIQPPILLHEFASFTSTLGMTELKRDIFYVVASNSSQLGSASVFSINMRHFKAGPNSTIIVPPTIAKVADLTSSIALNGMTHLRGIEDFVLISDTLLGGIWKTNVETGLSTLIIKDPTMEGPPNTTAIAAYGINGVRVQGETLFYCNSGQQTLYQMPVSLSPSTLIYRVPTNLTSFFSQIHTDGSSAGSAKLISSQISCDDFAIHPRGLLYVASPSNALLRINLQTGSQTVVAGTFNSSTSDIIGATSVQFGRTASDRHNVYVTTNGASFTCAPIGSQGISRVDVGDLD